MWARLGMDEYSLSTSDWARPLCSLFSGAANTFLQLWFIFSAALDVTDVCGDNVSVCLSLLSYNRMNLLTEITACLSSLFLHELREDCR